MSLFTRRKSSQPAEHPPLKLNKRPPAPPAPRHPSELPPPPPVPVAPSRRPPQELDNINHLDHTSPWGFSLDHGGPYEAAMRAIQPNNSRAAPLGIVGRDNTRAHDNQYIPPTAPVGVSLNLKPGQILPRNFQHLYHSPPQAVHAKHMQPASSMSPQTLASGSSQSPIPSRTHTFITSANHSVPLPNPHSRLTPNGPSRPALNQQDIGMAMFADVPDEPLTPNPNVPSPSSSTAAEDQEQEFNPYDPVNLRGEVMTSPVQPAVSNSFELPGEAVVPSSTQDGPPLPSPEPPPYSEQLDNNTAMKPKIPQLHSHTGTQSQPVSQSSSPGVLPPNSLPESRPSLVEEVAGSITRGKAVYVHQHPVSTPYLHHDQPSHHADLSSKAQVSGPRRASELGYIDRGSYSVPSGHQLMERPPRPSSTYWDHARDAQSTHPSSSSASTSARSGRPSSRYVPRKLVMPAPLNPGGPAFPRPPSLSGPSVVPRPQMQFRPPQPSYHPQDPTRAYPLISPQPPVQAVMESREIQIAKGSKLKKRVSLFTASSSKPAPTFVTTVSFAPPVIGTNHGHGSDDRFLNRSKTEKVLSKRLSKRRTNI